MAHIIDSTPIDQMFFCVGKKGQQYRHEDQLGEAVSRERDRLGIRKELKLYDTRGTAATRILKAGAELGEIAACRGWSIKKVAEVIEYYVALHPATHDHLGKKLVAAREKP